MAPHGLSKSGQEADAAATEAVKGVAIGAAQVRPVVLVCPLLYAFDFVHKGETRYSPPSLRLSITQSAISSHPSSITSSTPHLPSASF